MAIAPKFEADISADISNFMRRMATVDKRIKELASGVTVDIKADISGFMQRAATVQTTIETIANSNPTVTVDANTAGFVAQAATVEVVAAAVGSLEPTVTVEADTAAAVAQVTGLMAILRAMTAQNLIVRIRASWANYQSVMGAMAAFSRNFSEITGMVGRGITIAMSPAIVPVLASVVGLLGNLGPMIGTIAGSTFALGSAFGTAGIGAAAFGAIAVTNLKDIFGASTELKELNEKMEKAETGKERAEILKEIARVQGSLNKEQTKGLEAMNKLKDTWSGIAGSLQAQTIQIFTSALGIMSGVLTDLKPLFSTVMDAAKNLTESLGAAINAEPMQNFFNYLNTTAAPMFETISKAVGNFFQGFFNMMTAFGPLATDTAGGFLKMSEGFAAWSAGLGESKKFQAFVDYVKENMPKIRSIFSDAIQGIIGLFAGFGGSSSDMMTSLQDLMERFKNFSSTISENKGFQNFLDYIKTNGPVAVSAIGEFITLITNLGIAAAPMGEKMLGLIDGMTDFANSMLEAHPWLGKLAVGAVVLGGAFLAAMPILVGLNSLTGGFITTLIRLGVTFLISAAKMAAGWIIAMGPIGWIIIAVAALAIIIYKYWDEISAWTKKAWTAVSTAVTGAVDKIMAWIEEKFPAVHAIIESYMTMIGEVITSVWDYIKGTFSNVLSFLKALVKGDFEGMKTAISNQMELVKETLITIWGAIKGHLENVINVIKEKAIEKFGELGEKVLGKIQLLKNQAMAKWLELKVKTLIAIQEIKQKAIDYFAQLATNVVSKVLQLKNQVMAKWLELKIKTLNAVKETKEKAVDLFNQIKQRISEKMTEAVNTVKQKVGEMPGKVLGFVSRMVSAGGDLIQGLIDGAVGMASDAIGAIKEIAGDMVDAALSFFKIKSPSRVFMEMGAYVSEGLANGVSDKAKLAVDNVARMASQMTNAFNPQLAMADMRATAQLDTSINRADMGVVRKSFAAEIDSGEKQEQAIYVNNELMGDKILTMVNRGQAKQSRLTDGFYGK